MTRNQPKQSRAPKLQEIADSDLDKVQGGKKATKKLTGEDIGARTDGFKAGSDLSK